MANAERAIEALYEDAAVRDSLQDAEADTLLRWGEDQILRLAEQTDDEAAFDALLDRLRGLLKGVNRFVGERGQMDTDAKTAQLDKLLATGQTLGAPPAAAASSLAQAFAGGDDATTLQSLLALLTPVDGAAQATPASDTQPAPPALPDEAIAAQAAPDDTADAMEPPTPETPAPDDAPSTPKPRWSAADFGFPPSPPVEPAPSDDALTGDTPHDDETQDDWFD